MSQLVQYEFRSQVRWREKVSWRKTIERGTEAEKNETRERERGSEERKTVWPALRPRKEARTTDKKG